jgi:hypothetical protein
MFCKKLSFLIVLSLSFVTFPSAQEQDERLQDQKSFYSHKLSAEEQQIIDFLDSTRTAKGIQPLEVNIHLCKAMKDKLDKIVNDATIMDTVLVVQKLSELLSYLGKKSFLVKGGSHSEIHYNLGLNQELGKEVEEGSNIRISFCCVKDTLRNSLYSLTYLSEYSVEFFPSELKYFPSNFGSGPSYEIPVKGKINAKNIKYDLYQGNVLPFYYYGQQRLTEEMQTEEDGSFSFKLSFSVRGSIVWRVAIFAKSHAEEAYSLVDFWAL